MLNFAWDQERALEVRAEEAMEEGRREGQEKESLFSIRKMVDRFGISIEKAMDVLEIPAGEREKYTMMVKG